MNINLVGNLFGSSGYAAHTKGLFQALYEANTNIFLSTPLVINWMHSVNDAELNSITNKHYADGITVCIGTPDFWQSAKTEPCKRFYGYCVWEGERVPKRWIKKMLVADKILVPSNHVRDAILRTAKGTLQEHFIKEKIILLPHGVNTQTFLPKEYTKEGLPFTFLVNKGWNGTKEDRGGIPLILQAFSEEFRKDEPVQMVVKINPAYFPPGFNINQSLQNLQLTDDRPVIHINAEAVEAKTVPLFYKGDVFITASKAEAFNMPCLEALSCGIPVITTGYGGQTDYVTGDNGWLVPYELCEVTHDWQYEGNQWATIDKKALRKTMRFAYQNPQVCQEKGYSGREIALNYDWRKIAEQLINIMKADVGK